MGEVPSIPHGWYPVVTVAGMKQRVHLTQMNMSLEQQRARLTACDRSWTVRKLGEQEFAAGITLGDLHTCRVCFEKAKEVMP